MTGPLHPTGRGRVSMNAPRALACCDRCNFTYNLSNLRWQYQWSGNQLQNLRLLCCDRCLDEPQIQLRSIVIPPDPIPVLNPRPEQYSDEVPSYFITADGSRVITDDGSFIIMEIEVTPSPDPNNPVLYPPDG